MDDKKNEDLEGKDKRESLNQDTVKGPQKGKHQNQYGDKEKTSRTQ